MNSLNFLRLVYSCYWGIIGIDKFFGVVTRSETRISSFVLSYSPVSLPTLFTFIGILEIVIALLIFFRPREGLILATLLMGIIVLNLILHGDYDIAIHGAVIAAGQFGLFLLICKY